MSADVFTRTEPELLPLLAELAAREPIFHRPTQPTEMAPAYWEVGASGRRYSRDFILRHLHEHPPVDAEQVGWQTFDHQVRALGEDTFLFTYTLHQGERRTRRATIWRRAPGGWQILYHQGTTIAADDDDTAPPDAAAPPL